VTRSSSVLTLHGQATRDGPHPSSVADPVWIFAGPRALLRLRMVVRRDFVESVAAKLVALVLAEIEG
jgi:hypothetical protein